MNTELRVLQVVERSGEASPSAIGRELMITSGYAEYLCRYLVRAGRLEFAPGNYYRLSAEGKALSKTADRDSRPVQEDRELIEELAKETARRLDRGLIEELAKEIAGRLGVGGFAGERGVGIKTDFAEPIGLEDVEMETNIDQVNTVEEKAPGFETALELLKRLKAEEEKEDDGRENP